MSYFDNEYFHSGDTNDWYDTMQVCLNGHVINDCSKAYPNHNKDYCDKCGAKAITQCQKCNKDIQGYYHQKGVADLSIKKSPSFCHSCGRPYPWTELKIEAAIGLVRELELPEEEYKSISESIEDIATDNPRTTLAITRINKLLNKITDSSIGKAFYKVITDIASKTTAELIKSP